MLTLYRTRKGEDSDQSQRSIVIPAGRPYLTKINGKLVMAREKKPKVADIAVDLLGEAFGTRTLVRRRSRSVESKSVPLLLTGASFDSAQVPICPQTAPIPQLPFQPFNTYQQPQSGGLQPFMAYPSLMQPPQYPQQPQHYTVQSTGVSQIQPAPSKEEIENLKLVDAHFNKVTSKKTKTLSVGAGDTKSQEEVITKTSVTITKHVCANCGRIRSRKYHAENPLKASDTPLPAFCRKCQKDYSETSDSDDPKPKSPKLQEKKSKKNKKKSKKTSEDEQPDSPIVKEQKPKTEKKKKLEVPKPAPEHIIVEEELSDDDLILRGKSPKSKKTRPESPTLGFVVVEEEHSEDERAPRGKRAKFKKKTEEKPAQEYIVVEEEYSEDERIPPRGRRHSLRNEDSDVSRRPQEEQYEHHRQHSHTETFPTAASREDSFDSVISQHSQQSQRRRVERSNPGTVPAAPWDAPHIIHPRSAEETVVVTERYVYKPKKQMEDQRREQERESRNRSRKESEEAARYFHDDWAREDDAHSPTFRDERRGRSSVPGRYRRGSYEDSELAASESTDYYRAYDAVFHDIPPRAPSPPPSPPSEPWPEVSTSHYEDTSRRNMTSKRKKSGRKGHSQGHSRRGSDASEDSSKYRPPFIRQATDGGTETALVISPRRSRSRDPSYIDDDISDMTERELAVERETKRVTFRDPNPSTVSSEEWKQRSDVSESFLKRRTSWDDSAVGPTSPVNGENW